MTVVASTPIAEGKPHFKCYLTDGATTYNRCENIGCTVDDEGSARCGRIACPNCGFGGANISAPDGFDGDQLVRCSCSYAWIRRDEGGGRTVLELAQAAKSL